MLLIPFLNNVAHQIEDLKKVVFSNHTYEYSGNPKLLVTGSVLFDEEQNIRSLEVNMDFELAKSFNCNQVCFDLKQSIDLEKLLGFDSYEYIIGLAISVQDQIMSKLVNGNSIDLFDSEVDNLENWNKKSFLHQPDDLENEFNITWIGYWVAIKFEDSLTTWKNQLKK